MAEASNSIVFMSLKHQPISNTNSSAPQSAQEAGSEQNTANNDNNQKVYFTASDIKEMLNLYYAELSIETNRNSLLEKMLKDLKRMVQIQQSTDKTLETSSISDESSLSSSFHKSALLAASSTLNTSKNTSSIAVMHTPDLVLTLNSIEANLEREGARAQELDKMLNDLMSKVLNNTDTKMSVQDKENSLLVETSASADPKRSKPLPALQKICTRIIQDGIESVDFEELRFMHEEVYGAAHRLKESNPETKMREEICNLRQKINTLNKEVQLMQHIICCHSKNI